MTYSDIAFSSARYGMMGNNKSQILINLSRYLGSDMKLSALAIHQKIEDIDKASSIGIGDGVAILDWVSDRLDQPFLFCATLETPVTFSAVDNNPVDIFVVLVSPESQSSQHLRLLSRVTRMFRDQKILDDVRRINSLDGLMAVLSPEHRKLQTVQAA